MEEGKLMADEPIWGLSGADQDALEALLLSEVLEAAKPMLDQHRAALPAVSNREWDALVRRFAVEAVRAHMRSYGKRHNHARAIRAVRDERAHLRVNEDGRLERAKEKE